MRIVATALHDHPVAIEPAPARRSGTLVSAGLFDDPTLQAATSRGWDLRCPYAFEAVWNGGPAPEDIQISAPGFAVSRVGHGVLTFQTGYELSLDPGHDLWVRGPTNHLKDGLQPLDQVIEADLLPVVGEVHWQFTRPHQPVRFERGEPFGTLLPYPAGYLAQFAGEVRPADEPALPAVSCICPTYGRAALLEEAIYAFLQQDYRGPKELVVLNDYDGQVLEFDHPEVHVVNVPRRFRSLGEKLNAAVALCAYDLICVWADDDVSLPHRLSLSVAHLDPRKGFFKAATALYWNAGALSGPERNVFHGGSCWTRELFVQARGYPHETLAVDQAVERLFARARLDAVVPAELATAENYYVYRWGGTDSYHLSALAHDDADPHASWAAAAAYVAEAAAQGRIPLGRVPLQPRWQQDYTALAREYLAGVEQRPAAPNGAPPAPEPELPPIAFGRLPRPVPEAEAAALFHDDAPLRISVVLPACNESRYLQRTVEQFEATLPARSEIVVVDNGSTDGCADFLAGVAEMPPPGAASALERAASEAPVAVRLLRDAEPLGVAGARNRGLEVARGEVVVFADAHVDVPPGWWPPIVAALSRPGVGIVGPAIGVMGDPDYVKMYGQRVADTQLRVEWLPQRGDEPYPVPTLGGGFMALRRDVLRLAGGFDAGMQQWGSEDLEICLRLWLLGYEVWVVPEVEAPHYFRQANPYRVESRYPLQNLLRTAFLHLNQERLAHVLHACKEHPDFPRALALCTDGDVWQRRAELRARRVRDDDWFFRHPDFQDIEMELRDCVSAGAGG